MALLTLTQQQQHKPISPNWANYVKFAGGKTNFEQLQSEVEESELKRLLGAAFLLDIQTNPTDAIYVDLLDGKIFENASGNNLKFNGLRYMLAFMNWSKHVSESHVADTFGGMVQKNRQESTPLTSGDIKRLQNDAREIALQDFEIMKIYLNDNATIYPLWNCTTKRKLYTPKITGVKRTIL